MKKKFKLTRIVWQALIIGWLCFPLISWSNPSEGKVSAGAANIQVDLNFPNKLEVIQHSDRVVIDWQKFDIGVNEHTHFNQPSVDSIALNRIHSHEASKIDGHLSANGKLILINQNGLIFGDKSKVDVHGLLATTANISDQEFMQAKIKDKLELSFNQAGNPNGSIINKGKITAESGLIGLVAPRVINTGIIIAKTGKVKLGSADTFVVDLYGDDLLEFGISDQVQEQLVINKGTISADGGIIALTTSEGAEIINGLIVNTGHLLARSVSSKNGEIIIAAAGSNAVKANIASNKGKKAGNSKVLVSGVLDVSGRNEGERGGKLQITGDHIALLKDTLIDASGHSGKANTTSKEEPWGVRAGSAGGEILIGGNYLGKGNIPTAKNLYVGSKVTILNEAIDHGDAGRSIFWSDGVTVFRGKVFARSLGGLVDYKNLNFYKFLEQDLDLNYGNGGFVETSGRKLIVNGYIDLSAVNGSRGTYLLDPSRITIIGDGLPLTPGVNHTSLTPYSISNDTISEVRASYIASLGAGVSIVAHEIIFDLNGESFNWGTNGSWFNFYVFESIKVKSGGKISFNNAHIDVGYYYNYGNGYEIDLRNLMLDVNGVGNNGYISIITRSNNIYLGSIKSNIIKVESTNGGNIVFSNGETILTKHSNNSIIKSEIGAGTITFDLKGSNYMDFMVGSTTSWLSATRYSTINIGPDNSTNGQFTLNLASDLNLIADNAPGGTQLNFSSVNEIDLSHVNINNPGTSGFIIIYSNKYVKIGNFNTCYLISATDNKVGEFTIAPSVRGVARDISLRSLNYDVILDLKGTTTSVLNSFSISAPKAAINAINEGTIRLGRATATVNFTGGTGVDISKINIMGYNFGKVNLIANAGPVVVGDISAGTIAVTANGSSSDITIPEGKLISAAARTNPLTFTAGRNFINPAGSNAINLTGGADVTWKVTSASGTIVYPNVVNPNVAPTIYYLTITPIVYNPKEVFYGSTFNPRDIVVQSNPRAGTTANIGYTLSGYGSPEEQAGDIITGTMTFATDYRVGSGVGNYNVTIDPSALISSFGNYMIIPSTQTLNNVIKVVPKPLPINAISKTKVYGDPDPALTYTYAATDLVNNDPPSIITGNLIRNPGKNIGSYPILQNNLSAGVNYTISYNGANLTITPKNVSLAISGKVAKQYDGSAAVVDYSKINFAVNGMIVNDNVSVNYANAIGSYARKSISDPNTITMSQLALQGTDSLNYTLVSANLSGISGAITPKLLNIQLNGVSKTYDSTAQFTLTPANYTNLSGIIASEQVYLKKVNTGYVNDKNAGVKTVTIKGLSLGGLNAANYTLNYSDPATKSVTVASGGTIVPKPLNVSLQGNITKVYDGATEVKLSESNYGKLSGILGNDNVVIVKQLNATFNTQDLDTANTVTVTGFGLSGRDQANYTLAKSSLSLSNSASNRVAILPKLLSLTINPIKSYDGSLTVDLAGSTRGSITLDSASLVNLPAQGVFDNAKVGGQKKVTITGVQLKSANNPNYIVPTKIYTLGTINPQELIVSVNASITKEYDGNDKVALIPSNYTVSTDQIIPGENVKISLPNSGNYENKNVGTNKLIKVQGVMLSGNDKGNYILNNSNLALTLFGTTGIITPRNVSIKIDNKKKIYGELDPKLTYTPVGLVTGDTMKNSFSGNVSRDPGENVGDYAIKLDGLSALNYNLIEDGRANLSISKAKVVVTANTMSKKYLASNPNFSATIKGLKNNDPVGVINSVISLNSVAVNSTPKGKYMIEVTGPSSTQNYDISYVNGFLNII